MAKFSLVADSAHLQPAHTYTNHAYAYTHARTHNTRKKFKKKRRKGLHHMVSLGLPSPPPSTKKHGNNTHHCCQHYSY